MKIKPSKDWFERSANIEGDSEIGAGVLPISYQPTDEMIAAINKERLRLRDEYNLSDWNQRKNFLAYLGQFTNDLLSGQQVIPNQEEQKQEMKHG